MHFSFKHVLLSSVSLIMALTLTATADTIVKADICLNQQWFYSRSPLIVGANFENPGAEVKADMYVALEIQGRFFFYPKFTEDVASTPVTIAHGKYLQPLISGNLSRPSADADLSWYIVLTEPGTTNVIASDVQPMAVRQASGPGVNEVEVPAGYYVRGSENPLNETYLADQAPRRKLWMSGFYMDKYEVSNREYQEFMDAGGYSNPLYWSKEGWDWKMDLDRNQNISITEPNNWGNSYIQSGPNYPDFPVSGVSYYEAEAFANWKGKRLPWEAEWEKAARHAEPSPGQTEDRLYPWGDLFICDFVNYYSCGGRTKVEIDALPGGASFYGCEQMAGNVWEWVKDWYYPTYYDEQNGRGVPSPDADPTGPANPVPFQNINFRIWRGGSFQYALIHTEPVVLRCTNRFGREGGGTFGAYSSNRYIFTGFRCARDK